MSLVNLGNVLLALATLSAIVSALALLWGTSAGREGESIVNAGYIATFVSLGFVTLASVLLVGAFVGNDFRFAYVAQNHSTDVSAFAWVYKISGLWAGREGSLLFWEWMLALFAGWIAWKRLSITDKLSNVGLAVTNLVQLFFLAALFLVQNNPFQESPATYFQNGVLDPTMGMNPLLQTWAMVIHPPTLFIGYAGLTIPFAFAIAALIVDDPSSLWVKLTDRITVFSWLMLGIGIGLGALWAYQELAFGGFWAWDPVENASLLPWLTGVGLLHSFTVYRRRDGFKAWSVVMATVTFVLVLLGTFITRSGIIQSVHAFEQDPQSFWLFITMMVGSLVVGLGLLVWRRESFKSASEFESLMSKDASYYFNNVLMLIAGLLVAYWTLAPALPTWMPGGGQTFGPASYHAVARPIGILYIFIMAVCPILSWRKTEGKAFWNRVMWPLAGAAALSVVLLIEWYIQLRPIPVADINAFMQGMAVVGLLVAALAIALPIYLFIDGALKKSKASGSGFFPALGGIMVKARTTSGGYITHLGMGVILVGLIGSTMFGQDFTVRIPATAGKTASAGAFTVTFESAKEYKRPNGDQIRQATFLITENGKRLDTISPMQVLPTSVLAGLGGQMDYSKGRREVSIIVQPLRDIFSTFNGTDEQGNIVLNIKVNPLITWVWIGMVLTFLGTVLACWPKRTRAAA
jgi:cytochrome c-type biogenesis protein CcmF